MELGAGDLVQLLYHSVPPLLVLVPDLLEVGRLHMLVHGGGARLIEGWQCTDGPGTVCMASAINSRFREMMEPMRAPQAENRLEMESTTIT